LDLSAAFDTVDHEILLERLRCSYGISGRAHDWFESYLHDRAQSVRRGTACSTISKVICGVPQGSVLGPVLFILYVADVIALIQEHGLQPHLYADDTQIYGWCPPSDTVDLQLRFSACFDAVSSWMRSNRLQLNASKTEFIWCATSRRQHRLPTSAVMFGSDGVQPSSSVRNLGVYIDSDLVMRTHVARTVSRCFVVLRQLRSIRKSVPTSVFQSLVVTLVLNRLDFGNAILTGLPAYLLRRLESVLNASARLIFGLRRADHITDALVSLHWLRVPERIKYKVALLTYRALNGSAPRYLADSLVRIADVPSRGRLRSSTSQALLIPAVRLSTVGSRAFPVAAPTQWNQLPVDVTSAASLSVFRRRLKTFLFRQSYPNIVV
jgi:Reverse transcriptase (RNA-dependent DNA polymerase)